MKRFSLIKPCFSIISSEGHINQTGHLLDNLNYTSPTYLWHDGSEQNDCWPCAGAHFDKNFSQNSPHTHTAQFVEILN